MKTSRLEQIYTDMSLKCSTLKNCSWKTLKSAIKRNVFSYLTSEFAVCICRHTGHCTSWAIFRFRPKPDGWNRDYGANRGGWMCSAIRIWKGLQVFSRQGTTETLNAQTGITAYRNQISAVRKIASSGAQSGFDGNTRGDEPELAQRFNAMCRRCFRTSNVMNDFNREAPATETAMNIPAPWVVKCWRVDILWIGITVRSGIS